MKAYSNKPFIINETVDFNNKENKEGKPNYNISENLNFMKDTTIIQEDTIKPVETVYNVEQSTNTEPRDTGEITKENLSNVNTLPSNKSNEINQESNKQVKARTNFGKALIY